MSYRTIILPFYVTDQDFELIINTCKIFKQAVCDLLDKILELAELEVEFLQSLKSFKGKWYKIVYKSIPNKYYAESCCEFVYEIGKSLLKLAPFYAEDSVDKYDWFYSKLYEVELGDWLLFECRGDKYHKGNVNIRLLGINQKFIDVELNLWNGKTFVRKILKVHIPKSSLHKSIIEHVINLALSNELAYQARVYVYNHGNSIANCSLQITVPYDIYLSFYNWKWCRPCFDVRYILGFDVNFDNIAWCLIDLNGNPIDWDVIEFPHLVARGFKKKTLRGEVIKELHKLLNYIYVNYGCFIVSVEDPEKLGFLKIEWILRGIRLGSKYNYKVSMFKTKFAKWIIETCEKHCIKCIPANPSGTTHSDKHDEVMKVFRMNRHEASAYIIAKRGLQQYKEKKTKTIKKWL